MNTYVVTLRNPVTDTRRTVPYVRAANSAHAGERAKAITGRRGWIALSAQETKHGD